VLEAGLHLPRENFLSALTQRRASTSAATIAPLAVEFNVIPGEFEARLEWCAVKTACEEVGVEKKGVAGGVGAPMWCFCTLIAAVFSLFDFPIVRSLVGTTLSLSRAARAATDLFKCLPNTPSTPLTTGATIKPLRFGLLLSSLTRVVVA
jgi:hypothetical protein